MHLPAASCPANSHGTNVASGCTCNAGYSGSITATTSSPYYSGTCTAVSCPGNSSGLNIPSGCTCNSGYNGSITAIGTSPYFSGGCSPVDCGGVINALDPHASAICTHTRYMNTCTATCNTGYDAGTKSAQFTCGSNATWSGTLSCTPVDCGHALGLLYSSSTCSASKYLDLCNATCSAGYYSNSSTFECAASGNWTGSLSCTNINACLQYPCELLVETRRDLPPPASNSPGGRQCMVSFNSKIEIWNFSCSSYDSRAFLHAVANVSLRPLSDIVEQSILCHNASPICDFSSQYESAVFNQLTVPPTEQHCSPLTICQCVESPSYSIPFYFIWFGLVYMHTFSEERHNLM